MTQFLQIGKMAYNVDQIQFIYMSDTMVHIWFQGHPETDGPTELEGPEAEAFRYWWETKAQVYVCPVAEAIPIDAPERSQPHGRLFKTEPDDRSTGPDWGSEA